ncbi:MAG TPA: YceD family protein [Acetobacteraceae bacterium]|nr:YceD family protein [Acetobacteraceae bacterium]
MTAELYRAIPADRVGARGIEVAVEADAAECAALARRMQVPDVLALRCVFRLTRLTADCVLAEGRLRAKVMQTCVVSLDDFKADIDERFRVRFVPAGQETDDPDPEADDEIGCVDGVLDLGEAAAEQLALALDPYPRAPGAELPEIETDAQEHPFAALRRPH